MIGWNEVLFSYFLLTFQPFGLILSRLMSPYHPRPLFNLRMRLNLLFILEESDKEIHSPLTISRFARNIFLGRYPLLAILESGKALRHSRHPFHWRQIAPKIDLIAPGQLSWVPCLWNHSLRGSRSTATIWRILAD